MKNLIALLAVSTLTLAACGEKAEDPVAPAIVSAAAPAADNGDAAFEAKLQTITDPDELLALQNNKGGLAATLTNRKISTRMAELMGPKFTAAPNAYELYKFNKYAIKGQAEIDYNKAKSALEAKPKP